jgi:outer membrane protein TolC
MKTFFIRKNCWVCGICLLLLTVVASAQQKVYRLSELAAAATTQLPIIKQKQALLNGAKASLTDTRHSFLPQLKINDQVNLGTDNSLAGSYLPIGVNPSSSAGVRGDNIYQPATGNFGVLYAEYELVNFGLRNAQLQKAQSYIDLQQSDLERELYLLQADVARTYLYLLKAEYRAGAELQSVKRYDSVFRVIKAVTASGIKPGSDSSLAKAELSKAKILYNQTLGTIRLLKDQLSYLCGVPAIALQIDSLADSFNNKQPPALDFGMDTATNPLTDYFVKKNKTFLTNQSVVRKTYLPKISLAASTWIRGSGIQYNDEYTSLAKGLGYQRFNYMAGFALTYNLFSGIYKKDKLAVNQFQLQASEFELEQQKLSLSLSSTRAKDVLRTTEDNLAELPVQLQAAADTYLQKLAQYKAGIISLIDLTNASFVLYRSQTDYIETMSDWYLAQLDNAIATGHLSQFIQQLK